MLATPAEAKLNLPGFSFASSMKSFSVLAGESGRHDHGHRHRRDLADAGEILHRIERHGLVDDARDGVAVRGEHQRVAVGRRLGDAGGARQPGAVLDDHLLLPHRAQLVGQNARQAVGDAAGRERHDDAHGLVRIVALRRGDAAGGERAPRCRATGCAGLSYGISLSVSSADGPPFGGNTTATDAAARRFGRVISGLVRLPGPSYCPPPVLDPVRLEESGTRKCAPNRPVPSASKTIARRTGWSKPSTSTCRCIRPPPGARDA